MVEFRRCWVGVTWRKVSAQAARLILRGKGAEPRSTVRGAWSSAGGDAESPAMKAYRKFRPRASLKRRGLATWLVVDQRSAMGSEVLGVLAVRPWLNGRLLRQAFRRLLANG